MLDHVFLGGDCDCLGDLIDDTPQMNNATSGCPIGKDTCPEDPGVDPIHNFMDYSEDECYEEFTPDQDDRMRFAWEVFRVTNGVLEEGSAGAPDIPESDPCPANHDGKDLTIYLTTDDWGEESLFDLFKDEEPVEIVLSSSGGFASNKEYVMGPYCLQPGKYVFKLYDLYGDGICCTEGSGTFKLTLDDMDVYDAGRRGADFTCSEVIEFTV